ncbi:hypothetical protein DL93DRAFT_2174074 [Clavulina sp. PMI_390]|nr:hypothetical protein DL93DRAFT_2174074 [Clavulina sp. PMI_390]
MSKRSWRPTAPPEPGAPGRPKAYHNMRSQQLATESEGNEFSSPGSSFEESGDSSAGSGSDDGTSSSLPSKNSSQILQLFKSKEAWKGRTMHVDSSDDNVSLSEHPGGAETQQGGRKKLQTSSHYASDNWKKEKVVSFHDLPLWFEHRHQDWSLKEIFKHPYHRLRTLDPVFEIESNPSYNPAVSSMDDKWHEPARVETVYRAIFYCAQKCLWPPDNAADEGSDDEAEKQKKAESKKKHSSNSSKPGKPAPRGRPPIKNVQKRIRRTKETSECQCILHVEVYSNSLHKATIWQQGHHEDAPNKSLEWSHRLRSTLMNRIAKGTVPTTPAESEKAVNEICKMKREQAQRATSKTPQGPYTDIIPTWRVPKKNKLKNWNNGLKRRQHLSRSSFYSLAMLAEKNSGQVIHQQDYDPEENQPLMFICTAPSALQAGIMWGDKNGIAIDSSWRHKNENVAPLTFMTTVDDSNRMIPIAEN